MKRVDDMSRDELIEELTRIQSIQTPDTPFVSAIFLEISTDALRRVLKEEMGEM